MSERHLPVRPNLEQLKHQAKDLLRAEPALDSLASAQHTLARSYGIASWPRLVLACRMTYAIWRDDAETVRRLVLRHPALLREDARGVKGNWGPPMSYAANLGRMRIVRMLHELGAEDLQFAFDRACLQGELATARLLHELGARPVDGVVMGTCETLNPAGLMFLLELGARLVDEQGDRLAPAAMLLQGYGRNPAGKHQCLDIVRRHGVDLPDTPPMAVHRGRIDLLERHLARDPDLLSRTFDHEEIYPPSLGCHADHSLALHGTPLAGATLLHTSIDFDELPIARWLLARGARADVTAAVDAEGFGGHTPLFATVVVQPQWLRRADDAARLLLDHGADPNARASLRKQLRGVDDETLHEYRDVTPLGWGERFHDQDFVSRPAMRLIAERGGRVAP
ncbi:MAG TPA: hypothetical protein VMN81_06705 [Vicinamibacterales bacterium]|nr:hypothetical protein [Vicinamibacterales bacterium]